MLQQPGFNFAKETKKRGALTVSITEVTGHNQKQAETVAVGAYCIGVRGI